MFDDEILEKIVIIKIIDSKFDISIVYELK
jgi:hypothetical protein